MSTNNNIAVNTRYISGQGRSGVSIVSQQLPVGPQYVSVGPNWKPPVTQAEKNWKAAGFGTTLSILSMFLPLIGIQLPNTIVLLRKFFLGY